MSRHIIIIDFEVPFLVHIDWCGWVTICSFIKMWMIMMIILLLFLFFCSLLTFRDNDVYIFFIIFIGYNWFFYVFDLFIVILIGLWRCEWFSDKLSVNIYMSWVDWLSKFTFLISTRFDHHHGLSAFRCLKLATHKLSEFWFNTLLTI